MLDRNLHSIESLEGLLFLRQYVAQACRVRSLGGGKYSWPPQYSALYKPSLFTTSWPMTSFVNAFFLVAWSAAITVEDSVSGL